LWSFGWASQPLSVDNDVRLLDTVGHTRSTLVRILKESGRLSEFFINPQRFMDSVAAILKSELHQLIVDVIKYERIPASDPEFEWRQEHLRMRN